MVPLSEVQIDQILMNLVLNARDATPSDGEIEISARISDGEATLSVRDTGVGIPSEIQAEVCKPFFSTKAPGRGNGMGLAIVTDIVERVGGQVAIQSNPGTGTTVSVTLPLHTGGE